MALWSVDGDQIPANFARQAFFSGRGAPVPPDTNKGHYHVGMTEFWFVMEGSIGIKIEGMMAPQFFDQAIALELKRAQ